MSHIPSAAMKHAGPHHDAPTPPAPPAKPRHREGGTGIVGWSLAALGGAVAIGLIAAVAGGRSKSPPATAKRKRAKPRKPAQA